MEAAFSGNLRRSFAHQQVPLDFGLLLQVKKPNFGSSLIGDEIFARFEWRQLALFGLGIRSLQTVAWDQFALIAEILSVRDGSSRHHKLQNVRILNSITDSVT